jgi:hypothetical protein
MHPFISPKIEHIKSLPTLRVETHEDGTERHRQRCQERGFEYRLELKLETAAEAFWLLTKCSGKAFDGWKEGAVIAFSKIPDADGCYESCVYDESARRPSYVWYLVHKRAELKKQPWSWERDKQLKETQDEIDALYQKQANH